VILQHGDSFVNWARQCKAPSARVVFRSARLALCGKKFGLARLAHFYLSRQWIGRPVAQGSFDLTHTFAQALANRRDAAAAKQEKKQRADEEERHQWVKIARTTGPPTEQSESKAAASCAEPRPLGRLCTACRQRRPYA